MTKFLKHKLVSSTIFFSVGFFGWFIAYRGWGLGPNDIHMGSFFLAYGLSLLPILVLTIFPDEAWDEPGGMWAVVGMGYAYTYRFNPTLETVWLLIGTVLIHYVAHFIIGAITKWYSSRKPLQQI